MKATHRRGNANTMKLYSYVVVHDTGFAPNPFFGYCTLACCKPAIRRTAQKGDWIVGLTSKATENQIVYFMRVDDVMESYTDYWTDLRFRLKKPNNAGGFRSEQGDNIYQPVVSGGYRQLWSRHSNGEAEDERNKAHDLGGRRVLISETFSYFGSIALPLPPELRPLVVTRGHRSKFTDEMKLHFMRFTETVALGVHGAPTLWRKGDKSWMSDSGCAPRRTK